MNLHQARSTELGRTVTKPAIHLLVGLVVLGLVAGTGISVLGKAVPNGRQPPRPASSASHHRQSAVARSAVTNYASSREQSAAHLASTVLTSANTSTMNTLPLNQFNLMNYYPASAAWSNMWTDWNPGVINTDFAAMHAMSVNVVRLIIPPSAFGFPVPSTTQMRHLKQAVQLATQNDLHVQLTLFDWFANYADIAGSNTWLRAVVAPYASDPAVAFIELRNEAIATDPAVASWIAATFPVLKQAAGSVPVTVSVSLTPALTQLRALQSVLHDTPPSFYDVHAYGTPGMVAGDLAAAQALVAPAQMFVGETGSSTYTANPLDQTLTYAYQAYYYQAVEWATQQLGLPPAAPWTFTDFTAGAVPTGTTMPPSQYSYGLYTTSGTPKPAARVISQLFTNGTINTGFNNDFTQGANGTPAIWTPSCLNGAATSWEAAGGHTNGGFISFSNTKTLFRPTPSGPKAVCWPSLFVEPITGALVKANQSFTATAQAQGLGATGTNVLQIAWFNASGGYISNATSKPLPAGTTTWTPLSVTSAAPPGASFGKIYLASTNNTGTVRFSNVAWSEGI